MNDSAVLAAEAQTCWGVVTLRGEPLACLVGSLCAAPKSDADELALCDRLIRDPESFCTPRMRAAHAARLRAEDGRHPSAAAWKQLLMSLQCFGLLR